MPDPMSDEQQEAMAVVLQGKIDTLFKELERRRLETPRLRSLLAAAEAVCRYARHLVACERQCPCEECMSKRAKQSHRSGCICGFTEAQKVRQSLRGGGDDAKT